MKRSFMRIWGWPIVIAMFSLLGLIAGLVGDGGWDLLAALALGVPTLAAGWLSLKRRGRVSQAPSER